MPEVPDDVLLASAERARAALLEITPAETIGAPAGHIVEGERVLSLLFECTLTGYPGWHWTVTMSRVDDASEPSVLEAELMPGERALLAPDWVPWSDRLADYQASQEAGRVQTGDDEAGSDSDDDADDEDDDIEDEDLEDDDIDGVDIDELETLDVDVDETDESENDADDDGAEHPGDVPGRGTVAHDEHHDEGDQPQG